MKNVAPAPRRQKPLPIPVFDTIAQSSLLFQNANQRANAEGVHAMKSECQRYFADAGCASL